MGGSLDHPTCATGRAKSSTFTVKRYQMFVSAAIAFDPQKAMFERTTSKVVVELLSDESRQPMFRYMAQELGQVVLCNRIERSLLRFVAVVADEAGRLIQFGLGID